MRKRAQSLNEYILPIALVGLVGIVSLSLMGGNLNELFNGMIDTKKKPVVVQNTTIEAFPGNGLESNADVPFANLPGKKIQVDLGNGKTLHLNMADPVAVAEASGGNGVTENALAVIQQIITQLREQGEDEAKIAELEKLALAGQKIKTLQQQIEAKFPKEGFVDNQARFDFLINPVNNIVVDGQETTLLKASASLSYNYDFSNDYDGHYDSYFYYSGNDYYFDDYNYDRLGVLTDFRRQLQKVESSILLSNPALKHLVKEDLSIQIFNSSAQTIQAPTQAEVGALVRRTRNHSNDICTLSASATCQDRSG